MSVRFEVDGRVGRITLDRPDRLNAIDPATERRLLECWDEIENNPDIWCVVLTGAGERAFCVGADMKSDSASGLEYWAESRPQGFGGIALRRTLDVPVIARVNGFALGGGFEMVLGCDIVVACEDAEMGLPEPRVGRIPLDGGVIRLARKLPHNLAMGMLMTARRVPARVLAQWGVVNQAVPRDELDAAVDSWLAEILACAPLSLRAVKQIVQRTAHLTLNEAQALKLPAVVTALQSEDGEEGVRAFNEKRPPVWRGR